MTPSWLTSSVEAGHALPCEDYAAVKDLKSNTARNCPADSACTGCSECEASQNSSHRRASVADLLSPPPTPPPQPTFSSTTNVSLVPDSQTWDISKAKSMFDHASRYVCTRLCPLTCPNQALVDQLRVMKKARELEGESRSALSYARAIAVRCTMC